MAKYLGPTDLVYLWSKIKTWVGSYVSIASPSGKKTITVGSSSVDVYNWAQASSKPSYTFDEIGAGSTNKAFTDTEKTKLSNIAAGAEVNQNAFGKVKVGNTTIEADAKIDTLEIAAGSNNIIILTPDASGDKLTIEIDKDLSKFDNSTAGFITSADVPEGAAASTTTPVASDGGAGATGSETAFARGDHKHPSDSSKVNTSSVGAANGVCPLDSNAKIDAQYLPSYVDDVIEAYIRSGQTALSASWLATGSASGTVITPETGKIYVLMNSDSTYSENTEFRWGGSTYVKINDGGLTEMTTAEMDTATNNWA